MFFQPAQKSTKAGRMMSNWRGRNPQPQDFIYPGIHSDQQTMFENAFKIWIQNNRFVFICYVFYICVFPGEMVEIVDENEVRYSAYRKRGNPEDIQHIPRSCVQLIDTPPELVNVLLFFKKH